MAVLKTRGACLRDTPSMRPISVLFAVAVILLGFTAEAHAAATSSYSFQLVRAPHPLSADPSMTDPLWQAGAVPVVGQWENVTTRQPADGPQVSVLYDDANVYVGFVVPQPSEPIVATQTANDVGFGVDDFVAVGIDTSGNGAQAYLFEATPRGIRYQQSTEDVRYRPDWKVVTAVQGQTWRAVMIIPLRAMRLHAGGGQNWRIGFFRGIAAKGEHLSWAFDPIMMDMTGAAWPSFADLRFWPHVTGVTLAGNVGVRPKPRLEVYGLASAGADRGLYQQANGAFQPEHTRSTGIDASVPLTPTINFVGTANPDFSNVEIDQQTIAPQEFARQLTEYRPFFAEGAAFVDPNPDGYTDFNAPKDEVFYSPSIGPFDRGAKIEGTYGLQSFGLLSFRGFDQLTGDTFDDQAFGYKHATDDRSFMYWADGVLAHHSIAGTDSTEEVGARGLNRASGFVWSLNGANESGSWVPQGVTQSTNDWVYLEKPNYQIIAQYADVGPNYDPIDGFTTISDIRGPSGYVNFTGSTPGVKSWSMFFQGDRLLDRSGAVHEADSNIFFSSIFKNGIAINGIGPSLSTLRGYNGNFFTGYPSYLDGATVPFNLFIVPLGFGDGTPTPVDVSANWGSFGGNWLHLYTASTSRPLGSRYTLGFEYDGSYERGLSTGTLDSQWLRRVSFGWNIGASTNLSLSLRAINGLGGFSPQAGTNLAAGFHTRTGSGDLYINYGSPSAAATLDRLIIKYVLRFGSAAGT